MGLRGYGWDWGWGWESGICMSARTYVQLSKLFIFSSLFFLCWHLFTCVAINFLLRRVANWRRRVICAPAVDAVRPLAAGRWHTPAQVVYSLPSCVRGRVTEKYDWMLFDVKFKISLARVRHLCKCYNLCCILYGCRWISTRNKSSENLENWWNLAEYASNLIALHFKYIHRATFQYLHKLLLLLVISLSFSVLCEI